MDGFIGGLFVGLGIGVIGPRLLEAWLWTRERSRVSRAADQITGRPRSLHAEVPSGSGNGKPHRSRVYDDHFTLRRPRAR